MRLKAKFQDEDFELGEVVEASIMYGYEDKIEVYCIEKKKCCKYDSIKDFTDHWEDAPEEPKEYWYISGRGEIRCIEDEDTKFDKDHKQIGNYFPSEKEAEEVVRKLHAWKRLKDKGFRFEGWQDLEACEEAEVLIVQRVVDGENIIGFRMDNYHDCIEDLNMLFSGGE